MEKELAQILAYIKQNTTEDSTDSIRFFGECVRNIHKSNSQNFQDVWALYENKGKHDGFFVEFGATNGIDGSNTYLLEQDYFWTGILAEPNPNVLDQLVKNRNHYTQIVDKCVYTKSHEYIEFNITDESDLSTIVGYGQDDEHSLKRKNGKVVKVSTISLLDMLNEKYAPQVVDYLSIDTEGSEYDILEAFFVDNNYYKISCITVEHNYNAVNRQKLFDLLTKNGYERKFTEFSKWDDFYVKD